MPPFAIIALVLILARASTELSLSRLNQRYVRARANDGVLPWAFGRFSASFGTSALAMAGFLFVTGIALSILGLPLAWYAQFKLEERFGFNTTSLKMWMLDHTKGFLLALLLGYPLLALVLKVIDWTGANWWLWAAAIVIAFQLLLLLIAPAIIMPLFNKFTPLPEGTLRERLFALAQRAYFPTRSIEVMDSSKRSRHSNAFFTGFGRFRKIVLFDTLIAQLTEPELESVLAHEIGHYKKRHVLKLLGLSIAGVLLAFAAIAWLASAMALSCVRIRASGKLYRRECRSCDAAVCAAGGYDKFLDFSGRSHLVAPFRIRGGRVCACDNGRSAATHSSTAQIERKKSQQSHSTSALQQFLLLASDPARTGTRAANSNLAQAEACEFVPCLTTSA